MTGVSEAVVVKDWVWHSAVRYLDPTPAFPDNGSAKAKASNPSLDWDYYPRRLVEAVVDYLSEDLGCDHQVGICMCGIVEVVAELQLNLAGKKSCAECGGDGTGWDEAKYEAAKEAASAVGLFVNDFDGMINCPGCDGVGAVPVQALPSYGSAQQ